MEMIDKRTAEEQITAYEKVIAERLAKKAAKSNSNKKWQKPQWQVEAENIAATKAQPSSNPFMNLLKNYTNEIHSTFDKQQRESSLQVIQAVATLTGFASDVANSVLKYGKMSEKQMFIIAKAALESGKFEIKNNILFVK